MRKLRLILLMMIFGINQEACLAMEESELDLSVRICKRQMTKEELLKELEVNFSKQNESKKITMLNCAGQKAVDDEIIKALSIIPGSAHLVSLDLSETSITRDALKIILKSHIGTKKNGPQYSEKYERFSSDVYLNLRGSKITEEDKRLFSGPLGFMIEYNHKEYKRVMNVIKLLKSKL